MAGSSKGVQALLAHSHEAAIFVHCFARKLNFVVKNLVTNDLAKRLYDGTNDIGVFFNYAKRRKVLTEFLENNAIAKPVSTTR